MRVLVLGGTTEASALARMLAGDGRFEATLSLAGRTTRPVAQPIPCRRGGFGGAAGLAAYLEAAGIDCLVDATHPFAAGMTGNAAEAAGRIGVPLLVVRRPAWVAGPGDRWTEVAHMRAAAETLGRTRRRVLLTVGQGELAPFLAAPWHHYVVRAIERPAPGLLPPGSEVITARGPFEEAGERALLAERAIDVLVTKNSGGSATEAKLAAARALGVEVVMVARPELPGGVRAVETAEAAFAWLEDQHAGTLRGS